MFKVQYPNEFSGLCTSGAHTCMFRTKHNSVHSAMALGDQLPFFLLYILVYMCLHVFTCILMFNFFRLIKWYMCVWNEDEKRSWNNNIRTGVVGHVTYCYLLQPPNAYCCLLMPTAASWCLLLPPNAYCCVMIFMRKILKALQLWECRFTSVDCRLYVCLVYIKTCVLCII